MAIPIMKDEPLFDETCELCGRKLEPGYPGRAICIECRALEKSQDAFLWGLAKGKDDPKWIHHEDKDWDWDVIDKPKGDVL